MQRFNNQAPFDYEQLMESAKEYLRTAVDGINVKLYKEAIDDALAAAYLSEEVFNIIPTEEAQKLGEEAKILLDEARALDYADGDFPRYFPALHVAEGALKRARRLPDGFLGIMRRKEEYVGRLTRLVNSTRKKMSVHKERQSDLNRRIGRVIEPSSTRKDNKKYTGEEWMDLVDAYVELGMALFIGKNTNRMETLKIQIADITSGIY